MEIEVGPDQTQQNSSDVFEYLQKIAVSVSYFMAISFPEISFPIFQFPEN
jgi:hypothetical protein